MYNMTTMYEAENLVPVDHQTEPDGSVNCRVQDNSVVLRNEAQPFAKLIRQLGRDIFLSADEAGTPNLRARSDQVSWCPHDES